MHPLRTFTSPRRPSRRLIRALGFALMVGAGYVSIASCADSAAREASQTRTSHPLAQQTNGGGASPDPSVGRDLATLVPPASWTCGMPGGIPTPGVGKPAFTADFEVTSSRDLGDTQFGRRRLNTFGAGSVTGPSLQATLQPGGFELPLTLPGGAVELEQVLVLRAPRGGFLYVRTCGVAAREGDPVRVVLDVEAASDGPYGSLQSAKLVGTRTLSEDGKRLTLTVSDVTDAVLSGPRIQVESPPDLPHQTWECAKVQGERGAELYRETVGTGLLVLVGKTKRGNRTIIPITGGTTSGRIAGKVLPLGYDFPLFGDTIDIDARYVLETGDGALVLVRNCGPMGRLVPTFEADARGPYAFVNENRWLSTDPGIGLGSVSLTIFEAR